MTTPDEARKLEDIIADRERWADAAFRLEKELGAARAEIERLKQAAEEEFQKADGKAEMKRWFQVQLVTVKAELKTAKEVIRTKGYALCPDAVLNENVNLRSERDQAKKHYETFKAEALGVQKEMAKAIDEARDERDQAKAEVERALLIATKAIAVKLAEMKP